MPRRPDLKKVVIIGSGPIVIGQACEFDYSGVQACKALREEGVGIVLLNSNPATIMTDPEMADSTYIEPINTATLERIIERERPDAILPTLGGQTGLNVTVAAAEAGILDRYGVEVIGASLKAIRTAEDRILFKQAMQRIGLDLPRSEVAYNLDDAHRIASEIGFPLVIRPAFTLGGTGGGTAYNREELSAIVSRGLDLSQIRQVLIEESVIGWKEIEFEVMRDRADNVVIICSIENVDPMGVHTGDSITVAPAMTLSDKEIQTMRDACIKIIREVGVETGGSNIQFAVHPVTGRIVAIEMNPRVSRSSALASKATGFPIARFATKLAIGYTLDELPNDITKKTPACFEPALDYVVTKVPRWDFSKFPEAKPVLGTSMKSVGEVVSFGRTFKESLQKALRSLDIGRAGLGSDGVAWPAGRDLVEALRTPNPDRIFACKEALARGMSVEQVSAHTSIDPWFIWQIQELVDFEREFGRRVGDPELLGPLSDPNRLARAPGGTRDALRDALLEAKRLGYSDRQIAWLARTAAGGDGRPSEDDVRRARWELGIHPSYRPVDTCAGEFEASTPYWYSTYGERDELVLPDGESVMILGSGPNRIGQGIEFDYCCVHAVQAARASGLRAIMANCNPETVSTDYDTSDLLFFEPLTLEDVLEMWRATKPRGVVVQFGGQTPLKLSLPLEAAGVPILGTSPSKIDIAEDREKFGSLLVDLDIPMPRSGFARSREEALAVAESIGFPLLVRPSYVLGGRAMKVCPDRAALEKYIDEAISVAPEHPLLLDRFLEDAMEVDVDAVSDGAQVAIAAIMEHIEEAGVHSGDSACVLPPLSLTLLHQDRLAEYTWRLALALGVKGLINCQYAVKGDQVYLLEANPRASRTVPFASKATGIPWARKAMQIMLGSSLASLNLPFRGRPDHVAVKEVALPFDRFAGVDVILGPEMRSTGEVMGLDRDFGRAYAKSQLAVNQKLPRSGCIFVSVRDRDKAAIVAIARRLVSLGYTLRATRGTCEALLRAGIPASPVARISEGRPNVVDLIKNGEVGLMINIPSEGDEAERRDGYLMRQAAIIHNIARVTTLTAATAVVDALEAVQRQRFTVQSLQEYNSASPSRLPTPCE